MREGKRGGEKNSLFRFGCLLFVATSSSIHRYIHPPFPHLLSLLSLSIYLCVIAMLPSLSAPEMAKFSAEEAPSLSLLSTRECESVCRGGLRGSPGKPEFSCSRQMKAGAEASRRPVTQRRSARENKAGIAIMREGKMWPQQKAEVGHLVENLWSWWR